MDRVLRNAVVDDDPRSLGSGGRVDHEAALAEAYERGHRDGVVEGRRHATEDMQALGEAIRTAFAVAVDEIRDVVSVEAAERAAAALEIASWVVGREPAIEREALIARIERAVAAIDDQPLTLHLSDEDRGTIEIPGLGDITIVADPALGPGEARVTGPWSRVEITGDAAITQVREAWS